MMIPSIFLMVLVFVDSTMEQNRSGEFLSTSLNKRKQSNWLNFAGKTYYFDNVFKANFFKSMQYCRQQGMHLVSISNKLENDRLGKFVIDNGLTKGHFWTSAYNLGDNQWAWLSTGNNVVFTNWYEGEPSGGGNLTENCIEMRFWGNNDFTWNDLDCYAEIFFICESTTDCKK